MVQSPVVSSVLPLLVSNHFEWLTLDVWGWYLNNTGQTDVSWLIHQCIQIGTGYSYAQICSSILEQKALPDHQFAADMLPSLLALGTDAVANVRITLAKTLCRYVLASGSSVSVHVLFCIRIGQSHAATVL